MALETQDLKYPHTLSELIAKTKSWRQWFQANIERWHTYRKFVFKTTLNQEMREDLATIQKPAFEFNTIESYISRLRGEFSKQEPSFTVSQSPDSGYVDPQAAEILEGHLLHEMYQTRKAGTEYNVYSDQLSGGYGVLQVSPDYESPYTFNQRIVIERKFDPTLCGFDPTAQEVTKCDGEFCFEMVPLTEDSYKERYPNGAVPSGNMTTIGDYQWAYQLADTKIILVCIFYHKVTSSKNLVYLANNVSMLESDYNKAKKEWAMSRIEQEPKIISRRKTKITTICRYEFTNTQILTYNDTNWTYLPLIFTDGNSQHIREDGESSDMKQMTRPYHYHAMDTQKLKNIAGQTLANELEGMVQQKWIAPLEGIPEQYTDAYTNIQKPSNLIYNAFQEDGLTPIPPPQPVQRPGMPPEVLATFMQSDQVMQNILGSFNTQLGVNDNDISGAAIIEAMTQSNSTGMPYIVNFMLAWNQVAKIYIDLFPKVYTTPRTIPILDKMRNTTHVPINGFGGGKTPQMNYSPHSLNVEVEAGMNFEVQKNRAVMQMGMLSQQFQSFAQLINTTGLPILIDNLEFRGSDQLKQLAQEMLQKQQQQEASGQQQPNPLTLKMQDLAMRNQQHQGQMQMDAARLKQESIKNTMDFVGAQQDRQVDLAKIAVEKEKAVDGSIHKHLDRVQGDQHKASDIIQSQNKAEEKPMKEKSSES
ncbi:MAG TPA: hypothetical protein VHZ76_00945 [Gammaproteobacteria bacterium]|jgi:hypothetical protein|nr:hypothetical protein [Gammaproteobacteria bacterium]